MVISMFLTVILRYYSPDRFGSIIYAKIMEILLDDGQGQKNLISSSIMVIIVPHIVSFLMTTICIMIAGCLKP